MLDSTYSGTVVSTSSRFYTTIQESPSKSPHRICVQSPQFLNAEWEYTVSFKPGLSVEPTSASFVISFPQIIADLSISSMQNN